MRPHLSLLLLAACAWEAPVDPDAAPPPNAIAGPVVAGGLDAPATAVIFAAPADAPMPPLGTGRPATLTTVPAAAFTGGDGVQAAAYTLTDVPDGDWLITGFADVDGDFHPTIDALGGATCGDVVGGHLADLGGTALAAVSVADGALADGIAVTLGSRLPVERPAFVPLGQDGTPGLPVIQRAGAATPQGFLLRSVAVEAAFRLPDGTPTVTVSLTGPRADDPANPPEGNPLGLPPSPHHDLFAPSCDVAFFVHVLDADGNGDPDDHPQVPGGVDAWPQVGLTWLGLPVDDDADGQPDRFDRGGDPAAWTAPAILSPLPLLDGRLPVGVPVLTTALELLWVPVAVRAAPAAELDCDGTWTEGTCESVVTDPSQIPAGAWAITVIESTGQTWTVPNALTRATPTGGAGFLPAAQGLYLLVE